MLEQIRPELVPFDLSGELHVKSDSNQIAYRRLRQQVIERGWSIDAHKIETEFAHRQFTVIPSPARREVPELARAWQIKEVPVQRGKENGTS